MKRSRTVPGLDLNPVPRGVQLLHGTAVHPISGDGAHGIEYRSSLRIRRLWTKRPCTQMVREQLRMFKLVLRPLQTGCLFGTITVSAGAAPKAGRRKCF